MSKATDASKEPGKTDELIEFLSLRMFPEKLTISAQSDVVAGARKAELDAYLQGVAEYEGELRALSPGALMQLIEDEQQRDADAEQEEAERLETERFFNKPTARAYYRSWVERNYWTLDEATALILGKDPKVVNWDSIDPLVHKSPFARRYESLRRQFLRARFDGMLFEPLVPADFLRYAKSVGFALPVELDTLLRSDDEEQARQKRQAMDSIKLAELRKAIELASEPPVSAPATDPVAHPVAHKEAGPVEDHAASDETKRPCEAGDAEELAVQDTDKGPAAEELAAGEDPDPEEVSAVTEDPAEELPVEAGDEAADGNDLIDDPVELADTEQQHVAAAAYDDTANVEDSYTGQAPEEDDGEEAASYDVEPDAEQTLNGEAVESSVMAPEKNVDGAVPEEWYFPDDEEATDYAAERQTLLNIFAAMAVGRYGHELELLRDSTIDDIVRDHQKIGLACDENAIRELLQEASGHNRSDPA